MPKKNWEENMAQLYEFQGKALLQKAGISVPRGHLARSIEEVKRAAGEIGRPVVLKAQVWVTGRSQVGGIKFTNDPEEAEKVANQMFGMEIKGFRVRELLIEERLDIDREFFVGMIIDDAAKRPFLIFSSVGGTGIEEIARVYSDKVVKFPIHIAEGLRHFHARNILRKLEIRGELQTKLSDLL